MPTDKYHVRDRLRGPIPSIRPPFTENGELDLAGLDRYVDACLATGPAAVMITYGDSHLHVLSPAEIETLTRRVTERIAGRALVIASDGSWWTGPSVDFARWCSEIGVDMMMAFPPDWAGSCTAPSVVDHLRAVASAELPLMLLTAFLRPRGISDGLAIIEQVRDQVPEVVAVKDDVGGDLGRKVAFAVADQWAVVAGGSKQLHTQLLPYGCRSWLSSLGIYRPGLAVQYRDWIDSGDFAAAARFVREVDAPMFDLLIAQPGSFDAGLHGWLELTGIAGRWRRPPYHSLSDAELAALADGLSGLGLLDGTHR